MAGIADADRVNAFATQASNDVRLLWEAIAAAGFALATADFESLYETARDAP